MTRRRSWGPRRWAIGASALVALAIAGFAIADAAGLTVTTTGVFAGNKARCTNGPIATTTGTAHTGANIQAVKLSGVPAACAGLPVSIVAYQSNGNSYATGTGMASTGSFDIATSNYHANNVTGVALTIGTWGVPATWSYTPVVLPAVSCIVLTSWTGGGWPPPDTYGTPTGATCTATIFNYTAWGSPLSNFNFQFTVTGAANWELTFNFANTTQFPGFTPTNVGGTLNPRLSPTALCSDLPLLTVRKYLPNNSDTGYIEANNLGAAAMNQLCP
jgi:hypothetical protein